MVQLDLIELADLVRPEQLVAEVLRQNPQLPVPVPLEELAQLAGITKIEAFASEGFEGALITNATKSEGLDSGSLSGTSSGTSFCRGIGSPPSSARPRTSVRAPTRTGRSRPTSSPLNC